MLYSCFIIQSIVFESEGIIFSTQKFSIIACAIALQLLAQCIQAGSFGIRFSKSSIEILLKILLFLKPSVLREFFSKNLTYKNINISDEIKETKLAISLSSIVGLNI